MDAASGTCSRRLAAGDGTSHQTGFVMHIKHISASSRLFCYLVERPWRWLAAAGALLSSMACSSAPNEVGTEGLVRWTRASPQGPTLAQFPHLAASDSGVFIGYPNTVIAVRAQDGQFLWQQSTDRSVGLVAFGDSVIAVLAGGISVGLRQATGVTLWSRSIAGKSSTVPPVRVGSTAVFNTSDASLWAVDGLTGDGRRLASALQLSDTAAAGIWSIAANGDTAIVFLQLDSQVGETGDFVVTRVHVPSSTIVSRSRITRLENEFGENRRMVVQDSVVVLPIAGCALGVDARTGQRRWKQCGSIAQVSLRDGLLYATSGSGPVFAIDPITGRNLRRLDLPVTSPFDLVACREGIILVNGGLLLLQNRDGATPAAVGGTDQFDDYLGLVRNGATLFAHGETAMMALRCN
jgi:outer membrane protein assembly factor BamB